MLLRLDWMMGMCMPHPELARPLIHCLAADVNQDRCVHMIYDSLLIVKIPLFGCQAETVQFRQQQWPDLTFGLEAAVTMPGILTSLETCSDCK